MESTVGSYETKTHLPSLLERVARGERITITRHGVAVAVLVPPPAAETPDVRAAIDAMRRFRQEQGPRLGKGLSIKDLI